MVADDLFSAQGIRIPCAMGVFDERQAVAKAVGTPGRRIYAILRLVACDNEVFDAFFPQYLVQIGFME